MVRHPGAEAQLERANAGTKGEKQSRLLMGLGNALWVASAFMTCAWALMLMAFINAAIQLETWRRMKAISIKS